MVSAAVTSCTNTRARLRRPTSEASVATNGGKPNHGNQPGVQRADQKAGQQRAGDRDGEHAGRPGPASCGLPASSTGASASMIAAQTEPLKAITEPLDRSMPPEMMTIAAPRANTPKQRRLPQNLLGVLQRLFAIGIAENRGDAHDHHDGHQQAQLVRVLASQSPPPDRSLRRQAKAS